jgi:peptidoglycan/LPS O-acetylase OafA/YrhL
MPAVSPSSFFLLHNRKYPALDGLRALATLMIFNVHFFAQYAERNYFLDPGSLGFQVVRTIHSGSLGVDILFLLSGCLTYVSLARHGRMPVWTFVGQRLKRLLPVILAVNLPALCWGADAVDWRQLVDNVFFLKLFPGTTMVNYITWALIFEMWFYLFFCAVFILPARWAFSRSWAYFGLVCVAVTADIFFFRVHGVFYDPRFLSFLAGIALGKLMGEDRFHPALDRMARWTWLPALAAVFGMCWMWSADWFNPVVGASLPARTAFHLLFALAVSAFFWRLLRRGAVTAVFSATALRVVGVVSFSLFMTHAQWALPISGGLLGGVSSFAGVVLAWAVSFSVSAALAMLLFAFLERPYFVKP